MDSKDLIKKEDASVVSVSPEAGSIQAWDEGTDSIVPTKMPFLKIAHNQSEDRPAEAKLGWIYNNLTGEARPTWKVALLAVRTPNVMYAQPYVPGSRPQPLCKSNDGVLPNGGTEPQPGPCRMLMNGRKVPACPMLRWGEDERGNRIIPRCQSQYVMLLFDLETYTPAIMTVKKGGKATYEKLHATLRYQRLKLADKEHPEIPVECLVPVEISTVSMKNGLYYLPSLRLLTGQEDRIGLALARELVEFQRDLRGQFIQMDAAEIGSTGLEAEEEEAPF